MRFFSHYYIFLFLFALVSCKKDLDQIDQQIIEQYILDNNLVAESTTSGLHYVINNQGSGEQPNSYSTVTIAYTGKLTDGEIFDQSPSTGATFPLYNLIQGWQEGIPLFNEGGSGILLIPSSLGYGSQSVVNIPKNSVLIFEINLIEVN
jgi:FKBP-type peptidyl-prolyl cis-trans isomerase FkpA